LAKKKRYSSEYTMLSILEYMCTEGLNMHVTKYHLITNIKEIKQQRPDRLAHIMEMLEQNGLIKSIKTSNLTYYYTTSKGLDVYTKWAKDFLDFVRLSDAL
jgi:predicted transcriptional regulator